MNAFHEVLLLPPNTSQATGHRGLRHSQIPNDRFSAGIADIKAEIAPKDPVITTTTARLDVTPFHALICDARAQPKSHTRAARGARGAGRGARDSVHGCTRIVD
jgi:hypothetical protein